MKQADRWCIRAVRLPDGAEPEDLWIEGDVIVDGPLDGATMIEAPFVSPGLVDAHGHLSLPFQDCLGHRHDAQFVSGEQSVDPGVVTVNLLRHLQVGVTVVRDAGYVRQRPLLDAALPSRPQNIRSGWIVAPPHRYFPGSDIAQDTAPQELGARVREAAAAGMTWFKVIADFPGDDLDLFAAPLTYPIEVLAEAVDLAHRHGMRVMAHSTGPHVADIVEAGVDSVEHGCSVTPELAALMGSRGVAWTPTLATVEGHLTMLESFGGPADVAERWRAGMRRALAAAVAHGVPLLVGSDELPHGSFVEEALALHRLGVPAHVVVASATTTARAFLGLPALEPGAPADLVVFASDPRHDLQALGRPRSVMALGALVAEVGGE